MPELPSAALRRGLRSPPNSQVPQDRSPHTSTASAQRAFAQPEMRPSEAPPGRPGSGQILCLQVLLKLPTALPLSPAPAPKGVPRPWLTNSHPALSVRRGPRTGSRGEPASEQISNCRPYRRWLHVSCLPPNSRHARNRRKSRRATAHEKFPRALAVRQADQEASSAPEKVARST